MKHDRKTGWHFPDGETHLIKWMLTVNDPFQGRLTYQRRKYLAALEFVKERRVAVDIGGHVGLWSWPMSFDFERVVAFEPLSAHVECFHSNLAGVTNVELRQCALGESIGEVAVRNRTPDSSGDTGVDPDGEGELVRLRMLDEFELRDVDFLKCDCEGFEVFVMRGAEETLKRCKPVVIVEQKPETGMEARYGIGATDAVTYLQSLGYRKARAIQGDYIMVPQA
ncbi:MAG: FkbM family methyltransferase [Parvibaculum sp.]|uniref:FkbM family methyltransferase n=1 Tax=Parvibaculum sp. TaxID=2024848 RepID=UPI002ABCC1BB|nr:FkbM family methyltransferase [Parvibaculum sp.]MDZ4382809.1 FkbM family methyltransferase [Parvibaculum sp.]